MDNIYFNKSSILNESPNDPAKTNEGLYGKGSDIEKECISDDIKAERAEFAHKTKPAPETTTPEEEAEVIAPTFKKKSFIEEHPVISLFIAAGVGYYLGKNSPNAA